MSSEVRDLVKQYELNADENDPSSDIFASNQFTIITRKGVDKIAAKAGILCTEMTTLFIDPFEVILKGIYTMSGKSAVTTTACASVDRVVQVTTEREEDVIAKDDDGNMLRGASGDYTILRKKMTSVDEVVTKKGNVKMKPAYLPEMAEKRLNSRAVLKLTGFYDAGVYGEDEADDFSEKVKEQRKSMGKKPMASVASSAVKMK